MCDICYKPNAKPCGNCRSRKYCSIACQEDDWKLHAIPCRCLAAIQTQDIPLIAKLCEDPACAGFCYNHLATIMATARERRDLQFLLCLFCQHEDWVRDGDGDCDATYVRAIVALTETPLPMRPDDYIFAAQVTRCLFLRSTNRNQKLHDAVPHLVFIMDHCFSILTIVQDYFGLFLNLQSQGVAVPLKPDLVRWVMRQVSPSRLSVGQLLRN